MRGQEREEEGDNAGQKGRGRRCIRMKEKRRDKRIDKKSMGKTNEGKQWKEQSMGRGRERKR